MLLNETESLFYYEVKEVFTLIKSRLRPAAESLRTAALLLSDIFPIKTSFHVEKAARGILF